MMSGVIEKIKTFQSTAPVNVEALIESFGIDLQRKAPLHPQIAGEIQRLGENRYRISANQDDHYYRRRFTMAHELGHFLLHRDLIGKGIDDNRAYRSTDIGAFHNRNVTAQHESEANRFAANLLMPKNLVERYYQELGGNLSSLSNKFQVSSEAMAYRLQTLGLTPRQMAV
jgi:Zn-dependent peptidase ImmA (M78 family)